MDMLSGIGVVIDNEIRTEAGIKDIISKIRKKGIPTSEFDSLDEAEKCVNNFLAANFIILDWKMLNPPQTDSPGYTSAQAVVPGSELVADNQKKVIDFIKMLQKSCFAPVFIFTQEAQSDIEAQIIPALKSEGLYSDDKGRNFIYVRNKKQILKYNRLFKEIKKWVYQTPSIYLLKVWDREFSKAKNEVFWDLYNRSHGAWPKLLWQHFENEKDSPPSCINEIIFQLISSKTSLKGIDRSKIVKSGVKPKFQEVKEIFKRTMFQEGELLNGSLEGIKPGDIFKDGADYYMNIRPECDTVARGGGHDFIYLIKGGKVKSKDLKKIKKYQYTGAGLNPRKNEAFMFLLQDDAIVRFLFKNLEIMRFSDMKNKRLCRLLPPYITDIQQRFSAFLGRFGIPRLPHKVEQELLKT